ncbi:hypothetical protein D3C80_1732550 [compost metagenome]
MRLVKVRFVYLAATCFILAAGLSTRVLAEYLPEFISAHFGDALWAGMIYCGLRVIGVEKRPEWALIGSMLFCTSIELSQLYQAEWIVAIRSTILGGLVLGKGYLTIDLIRYAIGILLIYLTDKCLMIPKLRFDLSSRN